MPAVPMAAYNNSTIVTKAEIIAELPRLGPEDLADVQAKLDELTGDSWHDHGQLTDAGKTTLDAAMADYEKNPSAGTPWYQVKLCIQSKFRP